MSTAVVASNYPWTDFHSHCLPKMDDGAANVAMAVDMLRTVGRQGAKTVAATPHFYIGQHTVASFLKDRQAAYEQLLPYLAQKDMPEVILGAEVLIREGISRYDMRPLCLEGTDILLVEMPFVAPPCWALEELERLVDVQGLTLMYAHLDRYLSWYTHSDFEMLMDLPGSIMQVNADSIADKKFFASLLRHLPETRRMVLGTDMHDMRHRDPRMDRAIKVMRKNRYGRQWLARMMMTTERLKNQANHTGGLL